MEYLNCLIQELNQNKVLTQQNLITIQNYIEKRYSYYSRDIKSSIFSKVLSEIIENRFSDFSSQERKKILHILLNHYEKHTFKPTSDVLDFCLSSLTPYKIHALGLLNLWRYFPTYKSILLKLQKLLPLKTSEQSDLSSRSEVAASIEPNTEYPYVLNETFEPASNSEATQENAQNMYTETMDTLAKTSATSEDDSDIPLEKTTSEDSDSRNESLPLISPISIEHISNKKSFLFNFHLNVKNFAANKFKHFEKYLLTGSLVLTLSTNIMYFSAYIEDVPIENLFITKVIAIDEELLNLSTNRNYNVNSSEIPQGYIKKLHMIATAYDLSFESCGKKPDHPAYGITFTGTKATLGRTVAVDPDVIPLNSKLYIVFPDAYKHLNGNYIAEDTGSLIKGNKIDIFWGEDKPGQKEINKEAFKFGLQNVVVYILK